MDTTCPSGRSPNQSRDFPHQLWFGKSRLCGGLLGSELLAGAVVPTDQGCGGTPTFGLLQRRGLELGSQDAAALQEIQTAAGAFEALGTPANDADRARAAAISKRIVQFYTVTGRRRDATEWRKRFDAVLAPKPATTPQ